MRFATKAVERDCKVLKARVYRVYFFGRKCRTIGFKTYDQMTLARISNQFCEIRSDVASPPVKVNSMSSHFSGFV